MTTLPADAQSYIQFCRSRAQWLDIADAIRRSWLPGGKRWLAWKAAD